MCKNNFFFSSSNTACDHWRLLYWRLPSRHCEISIKATAKVSKNPLAVWLSVTVQVLCWAVWGQLQERISEKSEDEWGGSNSSPEVRFRIPGAHTTACLHTDIPAECLSTSKGPGMCVHVYLCMCVSVRTCDSFFEHVLNWTYYILINIIQHEHRKSSKHTAALFSLSSFIRGKNTQMSRGFGPPIQSRALITPHTPFTISSAQGWVGVSSHFGRAVHLKHRGIQRGETTGAFNCPWCLLGCCAAAFYFNVKASLNKTDSSL